MKSTKELIKLKKTNEMLFFFLACVMVIFYPFTLDSGFLICGFLSLLMIRLTEITRYMVK